MVVWVLALVLMFGPSQVSAMGDLSLPSSQMSVLGKPAPEFTLETSSGQTQSLSEARAGKKAMIIFWATWCPHCREELESVSLKLKEIESKGIKVILMNVGETKEEAKSYLEHHQLPLDSFLDEDNTISGLYGVSAVPATFLIDEAGLIRAIEHQFPYDYEEKFQSK